MLFPEYHDCIEDIYKVLNDNSIIIDNVDFDPILSYFYVKINNGDWKHDHLRTQMILKDNGYVHINTYEEPSDSDVCNATHVFKKEII